MNCKNVRELLPLFVGRDLDDQRANLVASHVQGCAECDAAAGEYRASGEILKQFAAPQFSEAVYDGIRQRVLTEIGRESTAPAAGSQLLASLFRPPMKWAVACGLLLALAGFSLYLIAGRTSEQHLSSKTAEPTPAVERYPSPASSPGNKPNNGPSQFVAGPPDVLNGGKVPAFDRPRPNRRKNPGAGRRAVDVITNTPTVASLNSRPASQSNNIADPRVAPSLEAGPAEKPLRVEIQTRDQNIRIIWFSHHPTKKNSPGKSSKHSQEARSNV